MKKKISLYQWCMKYKVGLYRAYALAKRGNFGSHAKKISVKIERWMIDEDFKPKDLTFQRKMKKK